MHSRIQKLRQEVYRRRARSRAAVIALDCMGSDHGPEEILRGAFDAVQAYPNISVIATGPLEKLRHILKANQWDHPRVQIENATEVVGMQESPKDSLRKKHSSLAVAAQLVKEGRAGGMVSPGNTGATMAVAMFQWRTLPGISRPAIAAVFPNPKHLSILLDAGANVDCKPRHLLHFAIMGSVYAKYVFHRRNPKVGILSIGEEESKGNELVFETRELLKNAPLNFGGNAEGRDLFKATFDVVVCDGFVGNIVLKTAEGLAGFIVQNLKEEVGRNIVSKLSAVPMLPVFKTFKTRLDYAEYGGAPLLGLHGNCIICHGSSRAKAIMNAVRVAAEMELAKLNEHIIEVLHSMKSH
jgi:phosphate acyltransferase